MPLAGFSGRVDSLAATIRGAPKAVNADRIWLPGEREWENREKALREGLLLPADVATSLAALCADQSLDLARYAGDR